MSEGRGPTCGMLPHSGRPARARFKARGIRQQSNGRLAATPSTMKMALGALFSYQYRDARAPSLLLSHPFPPLPPRSEERDVVPLVIRVALALFEVQVDAEAGALGEVEV